MRRGGGARVLRGGTRVLRGRTRVRRGGSGFLAGGARVLRGGACVLLGCARGLLAVLSPTEQDSAPSPEPALPHLLHCLLVHSGAKTVKRAAARGGARPTLL